MLIDAQGRAFPGESRFHIGTKEAELAIRGTSYGDVTGHLVADLNMPAASSSSGPGAAENRSTVAPRISRPTATSADKNATVYIFSGNKLIIECSATVRFDVVGYPVAYMIGNGSCSDGTHDDIQIIFSR